MHYRKLGLTGVEVSTQCLGAMMFGSVGNTDEAECIRIVHKALDAGVNFVDTADVYSQGQSEQILGRALAGRRDDVVIATKCFNQMGAERNQRGGSRRWITRAVEDSLRRLGTDYIDLYQVHRHDPDTDLDDTLGALSDLVHQGKIRYLGSSSTPPERIVEGQWVAERRHRERFVCEQPQYSILARSIETNILPTCLRHGIGVIPWSPLAGGWLSGKYRSGEIPDGARHAKGSKWRQYTRSDGDDPSQDPKLALVDALHDLADASDLTMIGLALGFVLAHPAVTSAIIGPRTESQVDGLLAEADVELSHDVLDAIDAIIRPGTDAAGIGHSVPNPDMRRHNRRR